METHVGKMTIPHDVLTSIAEQAEGDSITVSLESVDKEKTLTTEQKKAVGDKPVFDITIMCGDKQISTFNGGSITISLPYTLKDGETADDVKAWYLNDAGELEEITCSYDTTTGLATFTTDHLSYFTVGVVESENEDAAEAKKVDDLIAKISDPVILADKEAIEKARAAYNALTEEQKKLVTKLEQLEAAEAKLAEMQAADKPTPSPEDEQGKPATDGKQIKTDQTRMGSATGDHSSMPTIASFLLLALCGCGYLYRRRGKEESNL